MNHHLPWRVDQFGRILTDINGHPYRVAAFYAIDEEIGEKGMQANAEFAVNAVNAHEEAMELLERVTIELRRKLISGGMETNVAESLGIDELLIDIEKALSKAGVKS